MLRILNGMVDRYLELRLDRRGGDDDRHADWADAADEHAHDGMAEPATPTLPPLPDALEVRVNDLVEHIERVGGHARRLESTVESAVQLHFSATPDARTRSCGP